MEFSERLKTLRKEAGLTQVDVAEKLGISQPAYASWERGIKKPTQDNLVKLSKILYVSVDYLLGNTENRQTSDVLEDIELLFRMNSKGLTEEEKELFKKELINFMEERKLLIKENNQFRYFKIAN
ncbi:TPA: helix-turn-helix transcriptional regulator [Streptococcus pyogenes]|nr:helix-turn-helix transcriptional regulator [Streptococcus pyogenes]HES2084814.1 helix-turn-helix transcriptional regulator [Streptococcus pyogenes]HES2085462.1 helix-turn-helix transcriptional regulator [Streptococcus pyogenes]